MFKAGDKVRIISKNGDETRLSIFEVGDIATIGYVKNGDVYKLEGCAPNRYVNQDDLELINDEDSILDAVCRKLGVRVNEEWLANNNRTYVIKDNADIHIWHESDRGADYDGWAQCITDTYKEILTGEIYPVWMPKQGDIYYVPSINSSVTNTLHRRYQYNEDNIDEWYRSKGMMFKTEEEATRCAEKMIDVAKGDM